MTSSKALLHQDLQSSSDVTRRMLALAASFCMVCGIAGATVSGVRYVRSTSTSSPSTSAASTPLAPTVERPLQADSSSHPVTAPQPSTPSASGALLPVNTSHDASLSPSGADPTAGLALAFNETFGGTKLDNSIWSTCYSTVECTNYGNPQEEEWYQRSRDVVSGGALHLVAQKTPTQGRSATGVPETFPYSSGMVTTRKSFDFTYGYVQVEAKLPGGTGTWPALWLLPKSGTWPPEIDIMENWGTTNSMQTTYIWGTALAPQQAVKPETTSSNLVSGYHTYGLLWEPGSLTWYLDGKIVDTYTGSAVFSQPMYFLADLAVNGPAASGSTFDIHSVQIYEAKGK